MKENNFVAQFYEISSKRNKDRLFHTIIPLVHFHFPNKLNVLSKLK